MTHSCNTIRWGGGYI